LEMEFDKGNYIRNELKVYVTPPNRTKSFILIFFVLVLIFTIYKCSKFDNSEPINPEINNVDIESESFKFDDQNSEAIASPTDSIEYKLDDFLQDLGEPWIGY